MLELLPDTIRPFRVETPQAVLDDLHQRLERARWVEELPNPTGEWEYGAPLAYVKGLVRYWQDSYDWRAWEARLNEYPQFTTTIDGQNVHFLHVRSPEPGAVPLILSHGWPGSVVEFLDVIGPLTNPRGHGADPSTAFHLVIPSLPGYGFSGPTREPGWNNRRVAKAWSELMSRLGYQRYGVGGNDWGAHVAVDMVRGNPESVIGAHLTQIWSLPNGDPGELEGFSEADQAAYDVWHWFNGALGAYYDMHTQQPQTIAHALTDSPVGLLAWYGQIFRDEVTPDFILTNVMVAWLTNTTASNLRLYFENGLLEPWREPTSVPMGLAQFGNDFVSIRRFAQRDHRNIVSWNIYEEPGHYAAHQSPDLLVKDIRNFFRSLT